MFFENKKQKKKQKIEEKRMSSLSLSLYFGSLFLSYKTCYHVERPVY